MYVLDGHHKLVAYNNLNINPSYIVINRIKNENLNSYDDSALPELEHYLFYYQIDHIIRHGIDYMKISDKLTNYIDDFLRNTERIKDTLIFTFYKNISTNQFQIDQYRRAWILERFQVLFNRMVKEDRPLILDFFCQKTQNRRYELIKKWEEALELVIYDRNL